MRCNGEFGGSRRSSSLLANKDRKMFGCNVLNEGDAISSDVVVGEVSIRQ